MNTEHKPENPPAFPVSTGDANQGHQDGHHTWQFPGLTMRDYFSAKAMQSMMENYSRNDGILSRGYKEIADESFLMADAMLAARATGKESV